MFCKFTTVSRTYPLNSRPNNNTVWNQALTWPCCVVLLYLNRWQGHQGQEPVGDQRSCGHGCPAAWVISVQRGDLGYLVRLSTSSDRLCNLNMVPMTAMFLVGTICYYRHI